MPSKKAYKVFIVDDDEKTLLLLEQYLLSNAKSRLNIQKFISGEDAIQALSGGVDFVVLDYYLDSENPSALSGMEVLQKINAKSPDSEVIVMSAQQDMETTLELLRKGAYDYVIKGNTAFARTQLIVDGLIEKKEALEKVAHYKAGYRYAMMASGIFLILLILAILKAYNKI